MCFDGGDGGGGGEGDVTGTAPVDVSHVLAGPYGENLPVVGAGLSGRGDMPVHDAGVESRAIEATSIGVERLAPTFAETIGRGVRSFLSGGSTIGMGPAGVIGTVLTSLTPVGLVGSLIAGAFTKGMDHVLQNKDVINTDIKGNLGGSAVDAAKSLGGALTGDEELGGRR